MNFQRVKYKEIEEVPRLRIKKEFKSEFFGSAPAPFIGRFGYPKVNIGILSPQYSGQMVKFDSPRFWSRYNFPVNSVANLRFGLVNSRTSAHVKQLSDKFTEICQEVGMAKSSAEVEISLKSKPNLSFFKLEKEIIPFGPQGEVQKARVTANTAVDASVEKAVSDTDLKTVPALLNLYHRGLEENVLTKLISVGNLGLKQNRRLVPTRWSITAVDDTLGKHLITIVKDFPLGDDQLYFGGGWGNYYLMLFFSERWSYELFEIHLGRKIDPWSKAGNFYSTDYEGYEGRKTYAEECAGGYYAARLPILEKMKDLKRQHSCLVLRFITSEYNIPLGGWVCREAARKSLQERSLAFGSKELMLQYARELIKNKFGLEIDLFWKISKLLNAPKKQKKLVDFISSFRK